MFASAADSIVRIGDKTSCADCTAAASSPGRSRPFQVAALFFVFFVIALMLRWPYFFYEELGWDEILYSLIAQDLLNGVPPYVGQWDRKPIGIFLILAAFHAVFGDGLLALRLAAAGGIALSATGLFVLARQWLPKMPTLGVTAAVFSIAYTLNRGGAETNTELWYAPCICWAVICLTRGLRATRRSADLYIVFAFFLLGLGLQIKYVVVFSILTLGLVYAAWAWAGRARRDPRRLVRLLLLSGVAAALPSFAALAAYVALGQFEAWWQANIIANFGLVSGGEDYRSGFTGLWKYTDLFLPFVVLAPFGLLYLVGDGFKRGDMLPATLALGYLSGGVASLAFLSRFTEHMAMELVPVVSLLAAVGLHGGVACVDAMSRRLALDRGVRRALVGGAVAIGAALVVAYGVKYEWSRSVEMLQQRARQHDPHWGDLTAAAAAHLRTRLEPGDEIYVFGRTLGIYQLTNRRPPTDFAFHLALTGAYAPIDGLDELRRVLKTCPAFVVQGEEMGPAAGDANGPAALALLAQTLARHYVVERHFERFRGEEGRAIGEGVGLTIYRRHDGACEP